MTSSTGAGPRRGSRLYKHPQTGCIYRELGEAFAHPDGAREGRLDVVLQKVAANGEPQAELATVPFGDLHGGAGAVRALEPLGGEAGGLSEAAMELGPPRCYLHYKDKFYQELGRATSLTAAGGEEVVYRTLYPSSYALFTRPKSNFEGEAGEKAPGKRRFTEVAVEELDQEARKRVAARVEVVPASLPAPAGRVALVTGASAGLGRASAVQLEAAGYLVFAAARSADKLEKELREEADAAGRAPPRIVALSLDVRQEDSVRRAFQEVQERVGRLDVLVNNAGVLVVGTVEMVSVEQAQDLFETNFFGAMRCMHEALPFMRAQKSGCIVNVSTIFSEIPTMNQPVYAASKAALDALTLGTREAVRPFGISIHSLQPGGITDTAIGANLRSGDRFSGESGPNPYPIDAMVKESVFDRIIPQGQKSAEVAGIVVDMALGKVEATLVQTSEFTKELADQKLKDATGNAMVSLRY